MTKHGERGAAELLAEAKGLAERAFALLQQGAAEDSAAALERATALAEQSGDGGEHAHYLYSHALVLSQLAAERERARTMWIRAADIARDAQRLDVQFKARQRLTQMRVEDGDLVGAIAEVTRVIEAMEALGEQGRQPGLAHALRDRARLHLRRGISEGDSAALESAHADFGRADELARALELAELSLALRLERRSLEALMPERAAAAGDFAALRAEAEALGSNEVIGALAIEEASAAMRAGEHEDGLGHAERARQAALEGNEPVRYLIACMLIAEAREKLGDRAGVIAILLTCKASLEQLLGKAVGRELTRVLDSLEGRWGREGVATALAEYRARTRH